MSHIDTILCPADLSPPSHEALRYCLDLARSVDARVHVAHVLPPCTHAGRLTSAMTPLATFLSPHDMAGLDVHWHLLSGRPEKELARLARAVNADLIIVGTHHPEADEHTLAEALFRTTGVPILTVIPSLSSLAA